MRVQDYDTSAQYHATVVATDRLTPEDTDEVRELVLDVPSNGTVFEVGQSVGVLAPGQDEFGQAQHLRLYSLSDLPEPRDGGRTRLRLTVKRCFYIDEYSGERYPGRASNYLCDRRPGQTITLVGPYGMAFAEPREADATLILVATSTGIAPFRAFVRHLYEREPAFEGHVHLFYGGRSSNDLVYLNDARDDFERYRDASAFTAYEALSARPHWTDTIDWRAALAQNGGDALWKLLESPRTYVYVAGLEKEQEGLHAAFATLAGGREAFDRRRAELTAGGRWVEVLY